LSFDEYARTWDVDQRIRRAKIIADHIVYSLDMKQNQTAMEFGCGTGLISFNLYDRFSHITMIDNSEGMIEILTDKINKFQISNMEAKRLDLLEDRSFHQNFDVIYHSMVLHHIKNTSIILQRFYELLNEDGYLCIVDLDEEDGSFHKEYPDFDGHNGFNQENLRELLRQEGFQEISSETFYHDQKIIDGKAVNYSLFIMIARK
jgi:ubiquinone/menaquinone biosynthesis C-methylase UbiE